jgi:formylglycine-generating enzyme required for sulfatase activity
MTNPKHGLVTASDRDRPVIPEQVKDHLAERQARAAVALVRMGGVAEVLPLLRHGADPRLRSFIVNWLRPLGAYPRPVADELGHIPATNQPTPARGQSLMDAVLFDPETSLRRALILALGTYGTEELSPADREPLITKLLELHRVDPDAGIHGAAEWTLRRCGQQEKIRAADAELSKVKEGRGRRWYVNGQGQTFAVIEGPVEFRMGSPESEPGRIGPNEPLRRVLIPRRFAIAAKEVTIEQFQRFVKTHAALGADPDWLRRFSPDPDGPWIGPDWYAAAAYCNWLSEQEGIPRDQWCYLPNGSGTFAEGMTIPADVLVRTGYRLPTAAEWEYACREGTVTSRFYGHSLDLLAAYARYQTNSMEHAWKCGGLLPNDLGLFDMLGNVYEWCQDGPGASRPVREGLYRDIIASPERVRDKNARLLRGGTRGSPPFGVRSAVGYGEAPSSHDLPHVGFRPARTCP